MIAIHKLVDIHNALPESSAAKTAILRRIEQQVDQLDTQDTARRNPIGVVLGVLILIVAGAASWLMASTGAWWWLATPGVALLWAAGFIGIGQSLPSVPRAANGQSLDYQSKQADKQALRRVSQATHS
ncbi:hypothetical protein E3T26_03945 [Cryobacterium sp. TMT1-21]|uniref:hypothetical protein n=1 Tax=Cryobacterium sp. TMT1-21 TaxID=1259234 RepID=UPI001069E459|nr:hypothetical protein [Cryobacterium sp. TMT1-21]TFD16603.1 hypothetical protein E3T26_03945 [Cryobacterium sp. TMT1-21]